MITSTAAADRTRTLIYTNHPNPTGYNASTVTKLTSGKRINVNWKLSYIKGMLEPDLFILSLFNLFGHLTEPI